MVRYWRVLVLVLALWLTCGMLLHEAMMKTTTDDESLLSDTYKDLRRQQQEIIKAYAEISRLIEDGALLNSSDRIKDVKGTTGGEPTLQLETIRRKVEMTTTEFWYFISDQLKSLEALTKEDNVKDVIKNILGAAGGYQRTLKRDWRRLNNEQEDWRQKESKSLGDLIHRRLDYLQNPRNCSVRKLYCTQKHCGYGCQIHHMSFCLLSAYASKRFMVLEGGTLKTYRSKYDTLFRPLSNTCETSVAVAYSASKKKVIGLNLFSDDEVAVMGSIDYYTAHRDYRPPAIPSDIASRLTRFHGNPPAWWIGQFTNYLTRPNVNLTEKLNESAITEGFQHPIVGVHIRRTDKKSEARYHDVDEYMSHVDEWFSTYHGSVTNKRLVYLATDQADVLDEARKQYPKYKFISNIEVAKNSKPERRYSDLWGIIKDIHFLSLCDHLVCTFSSQVCRMAYEQMQTMHGDASTWFTSLDDVYYYGGQTEHQVVAVESHQPNSADEKTLNVGDTMGLAGNHWNGFSKAMKGGLFPSYKVQDVVKEYDFPRYSEVPDHQ